MTTRLVLVRHPESASVRPDAELLAEELASAGIAHLYSSDLHRALEPAEMIAKRLGLSVTVDERLREIHFGELEGRSYEDIELANPVFYRSLMERPREARFPGGESYADLRARAASFLGDVLERHRGSAVAAISHGGTNRALLGIALNLADADVFRLAQDHGRVSVVDWYEDTAVVQLLNGRLR